MDHVCPSNNSRAACGEASGPVLCAILSSMPSNNGGGHVGVPEPHTHDSHLLQWWRHVLSTNETAAGNRAFLLQLWSLGWGTAWHPFWYFVLIVYTLNVFWAPFLVRYTEETIVKNFVTRFWCKTVMPCAILMCVFGQTLSGTSNLFSAWLPFGDVSLTTLVNYFQVRHPPYLYIHHLCPS